ncbi:FAD-dependent oxidoreductase [Rhizobium sp. NRK18]|uniref:FAD-dependent oxidoreductase n=1 Tax=Rhizobium sp. NRK18 TaxID=2964667 RepID=UPI0021C46353|nr:FAD-dependent oxidoreductase [Rhizobium sp. NRK18]MCQ2002514.1 FAD-dependent oxidoreductase [Rhizobium sp. NRK18]
MTRLFLAGGGHAHLIVLEYLARHPQKGLDIIIATPSPWQYYSGMLPGLIAGRYREEDCRIDIGKLAAKAGVRLILEPLVAINADRNNVFLSGGKEVAYDLLSLDIGSETDVGWFADRSVKLLPAKPLDAFIARWRDLVASAQAQRTVQLTIVGGGTAGVELALATKTALDSTSVKSAVSLVVGPSGVLAAHGDRARRLARGALARSGISVHESRATGHPDGVSLSDGSMLNADFVIAATGARPASWLSHSKLALDRQGFVLVDDTHRSVSHPNVFAVGDVASRSDVTLERSGVHAVRAAPILAQNLIAALRGEALKPYNLRKRSLYILATGRDSAIASWGKLSVEGRWVWRWKDHIDRSFIDRFKV